MDQKDERRERRRNTWRAIRRILPRLVDVLQAAAPEVVAALADGRVTTAEAVAIGLAVAEALAPDEAPAP